jgi:hypothetical protein
MLKRPFVPALVVTVLLAGAFMPVSAQRRSEWEFSCSRNRSWNDDGARACKPIDQTIQLRGGKLLVDSRVNGGIIVIGENRRDVALHAVVEAHARNDSRAEDIIDQVRIRTDEGRISADGPDTGRNEWWSVNFELHVPMNTDLDLMAHNGGISVADVTGLLRMATLNGGIHLDGVNGDVVAETTNGGVHVDLDGDRWEGKGLDATTTNGGVHVRVPDGYSAHLETATTNGGMEIDFPVTVQGRIGRRISADLGKGGPTIRVTTTNGGVTISKGR